MDLYVRAGRRYRPASKEHVLEVAAGYQLSQYADGVVVSSPSDAKTLVASQLRGLESEQFGVLWLTARHRTICWEILFKGTVDGATVHPREVVKRALAVNAAAVICAHQHPSGDPTPSEHDRQITRRLNQALELIGVRLLDHFIVGKDEVVSLAEKGGW